MRSTTSSQCKRATRFAVLVALLLAASPFVPTTKLAAEASPSALPTRQSMALSAATPRRPISWLAAGDSFSSGFGNAGETGECYRSPGAWGSVAHDQLAKDLPTAKFDFRACAGAVTSDLFAATPDTKTQWRVGNGRYDLVTFSFGGNDVGFADELTQCILSGFVGWIDVLARPVSGCRSDDEVRKHISDVIGAEYLPFLRRVATDVVSKGGNLVVVGYPALVEDPDRWVGWAQTADNCNGISRDDAPRIRGWSGLLNQLIARAVSDLDRERINGVHVSFVNVQDGAGSTQDDPRLFEPNGSSRRHNLCANDSWILNLRLAADHKSIIHPNLAGHEAMSHLVADKLRGLHWDDLVPSDVETLATEFVHRTITREDLTQYGTPDAVAQASKVFEQLSAGDASWTPRIDRSAPSRGGQSPGDACPLLGDVSGECTVELVDGAGTVRARFTVSWSPEQSGFTYRDGSFADQWGNPVAPPMIVTGIAVKAGQPRHVTGSLVNMRKMPTSDSEAASTTLSRGATVTVECQTWGRAIQTNGDQDLVANPHLWNRLENGLYVADLYLDTVKPPAKDPANESPGRDPGLPLCLQPIQGFDPYSLLDAEVPSLCEHPAGHLRYGELPNVPENEGGAWLELESLVVGDLDGDGQPEAAVQMPCFRGGIGWPPPIVLYDHTTKLITKLELVDLDANATGRPYIDAMTIRDGRLVIDFVTAYPGENDLWPTRKAHAEVHLANGHIEPDSVTYPGG